MKDLYAIVVQRRQQAAAVQLNYTDKDRALAAFAEVEDIRRGQDEGGANARMRLERLLLKDDFGARLRLDPEDIGHVILIDQVAQAKLQVGLVALQMATQQRAQGRAQKMLETDTDIVVPRASTIQLAR